MANGVVHPITQETITKYERSAHNPVMREVWTKTMCKELGWLAQCYGNITSTNTVFFMTIDEIKIPKDQTGTNACIVASYRPQKEDPNRVQITVGGNLIEHPGEFTTCTAISQQPKLYGTVYRPCQECKIWIRRHWKFLSWSTSGSIRMYVWSLTTRRVQKSLKFAQHNYQRIHLPQDLMRVLLTSTGRHLGQQIAQKMHGETWVLQTAIHSWSLETC